MSLSLQEYLTKVASGDLNPKETILQYLQNIQEKNAELFPFLRVHETYLEQQRDTLGQ
ncbi:MAG: hypothetical protein LBU27_00120 [Candidatus Peribacteria bacterium]|jgi:hypothetical protein|nr:hypothetical protein [Candidatus Peribacteria bacterium]